ncbi:MAG: hypothetical protein ABH873_01890 [Candidatus Firestonebacteria bacterium]
MLNNRFILIEIDGDLFKCLVIKRKGKTNFTIEKAFKTDSKDTNFKDIFNEFKRDKIILSFPRELLIMRMFNVKSSNPDDIYLEVKKEIDESLPFEKEILWDAIDVREVKKVEKVTKVEKGNKVLFAATKKDTINQYLNKIKETGLTVKSIIPSTIALIGAYHLSPSYSKKSTLLVYAGTKRADLIVCENDTILMSRGVEFKNDANEEMKDSIKQTISSMKQNNISIERVVLNDVADKIKDLTSIKVEKFKVPSVEVNDKNIDFKDFILCVGLGHVVTGLNKICLDLNKNKVDKLKKTPLNKLILKISLGISVVLLLLSFVFFVLGKIEENSLSKLKTEVTSLGLISGKPWSEVISKVFKSVPEGVVLIEVSGDERGEIVIRGNTSLRKEITELLNSLNKIQGFTSELNSANEISTLDKQLIQFQIKIRKR